jgi:hypothetical protein
MSCTFTENISLLIDGALSSQEATQARNHIAACSDCRDAMDQFLGLRDALRAYTTPDDDLSQRRALNMILSSGRPPIWARRISIPAPAVALILISFIVLGTWSVAMRVWEPRRRATTVPSAAQSGNPDPPSTQAGIELSRLDHGGRAVIVKVPKNATAETSDSGRKSQ